MHPVLIKLHIHGRDILLGTCGVCMIVGFAVWILLSL
jgi:hypothetical protein